MEGTGKCRQNRTLVIQGECKGEGETGEREERKEKKTFPYIFLTSLIFLQRTLLFCNVKERIEGPNEGTGEEIGEENCSSVEKMAGLGLKG